MFSQHNTKILFPYVPKIISTGPEKLANKGPYFSLRDSCAGPLSSNSEIFLLCLAARLGFCTSIRCDIPLGFSFSSSSLSSSSELDGGSSARGSRHTNQITVLFSTLFPFQSTISQQMTATKYQRCRIPCCCCPSNETSICLPVPRPNKTGFWKSGWVGHPNSTVILANPVLGWLPHWRGKICLDSDLSSI